MPLRATDQEAEELRKVAISGVQSVEADGRKIVYRSLADQLRVLGEVQATAAEGAGAGGGAGRRRRVAFCRGYR